MAAFKMRGRLLLAEMEENDEVYCPFMKQQADSQDRGQEENKEETEEEEEKGCFNDKKGFRSEHT